MTVACVVQARMGSTRLPGKVLQEVDGMPMLAFLLRRLARLEVDSLAVATSTLAADDAVADVAAREGVAVVRGDEQDVLARYVRAADELGADTLVRITGDCPLTDPGIVADVLARHRAEGADYASNILPRTFPKGLDVEVASARALRLAAAEATAPLEREHVMPFLYRHPERFSLASTWSTERLGGRWWTVDTADDLAFVRTVVDLLADPLTATWRDVLAVAPSPPPPDVTLVPSSPEAAQRAAVALGVPWAVEYEVHAPAGAIGTVLVGVEAAAAVADVRVEGSSRDALQALVALLRAGVQVDRLRLAEPTPELTASAESIGFEAGSVLVLR